MFLSQSKLFTRLKQRLANLWAGNAGTHESHKVAWKIVCSPKKEGELGMLDLKL